MKLNKKKLIAREFLILISCILLFLLAFLGTFTYNNYLNNQKNNLNEKLQSKEKHIDSLMSPYRIKKEKQKWLFKEFSKRFRMGEANTPDKLWKDIIDLKKKDSLIHHWNNLSIQQIDAYNKVGFDSGQEFKIFIKENHLTSQDIADTAKAHKIQKSVNQVNSKIEYLRSKKLNSKERKNFLWLAFLIIFGAAFPLRWIVIGTKWSIRTLKYKE